MSQTKLLGYTLSEPLAAGLVYSLSSISMLLINKLAVRAFHETFFLLALQNIATLLIRRVWTSNQNQSPAQPQQADSITKAKFAAFVPAMVLFMTMLFSSLRSLYYVSIPTVIVFRNINSLAVALGEIALLKKVITRETWGAMVVIIIGAFAYANWDIEYHPVGYFWTFLNIAAMCGYSLYVKWVTEAIKYTSMEMVYLNNVSSTPIFLLVSLYLGEDWAALTDMLFKVDDDGRLFKAESFWVVLSCGMAFAISASGFWAQTVFSATTWITLNNINKIPVIVLSAYIFNDKLSVGSIVGLIISLIGGGMYSWATRPQPKQAPVKKSTQPEDDASRPLMKSVVFHQPLDSSTCRSFSAFLIEIFIIPLFAMFVYVISYSILNVHSCTLLSRDIELGDKFSESSRKI